MQIDSPRSELRGTKFTSSTSQCARQDLIGVYVYHFVDNKLSSMFVAPYLLTSIKLD